MATHTNNKTWVRGGVNGTRGRGRGRGGSRPASPSPSPSPALASIAVTNGKGKARDDGEQLWERVGGSEIRPEDEVMLEGTEEREMFWKELVKAREEERKKALKEGRMDDPFAKKKLEDAFSIRGTCPDMCPRFERYRRERENNLFGEWETLPPPNNKRVDHRRAVKMYERAAGDKVIPSDIRPEPILVHTLDYLFQEMIPTHGFGPTFNFIRDRSRSVRNEFEMQGLKTPGTIVSFCRCTRFHILALHTQRASTGFSLEMEEQMAMHCLQSLQYLFADTRDSPTQLHPSELEMWLYHRLLHIRVTREKNEGLPACLEDVQVYRLVTQFRAHVQAQSTPITKKSALKVGQEGMRVFGEIAGCLHDNTSNPDPGLRTNRTSVFLIACILERLFGEEAIGADQMAALRAGLSDVDIIDGVDPALPTTAAESESMHTASMNTASASMNTASMPSVSGAEAGVDDDMQDQHVQEGEGEGDEVDDFLEGDVGGVEEDEAPVPASSTSAVVPVPVSAFGTPAAGGPVSAFGGTAGGAGTGVKNVFGGGTFGAGAFGTPTSTQAEKKAALNPNAPVFMPGSVSAFGDAAAKPTSLFGETTKPAGTSAFGPGPGTGAFTSTPTSTPVPVSAFGQPGQPQPQPSFGKPAVQPQPQQPLFGEPTGFGDVKKSAAGLGEGTKPIFGDSSKPATSIFGGTSKSAASIFGESSKPAASIFGEPSKPAVPMFTTPPDQDKKSSVAFPTFSPTPGPAPGSTFATPPSAPTPKPTSLFGTPKPPVPQRDAPLPTPSPSAVPPAPELKPATLPKLQVDVAAAEGEEQDQVEPRTPLAAPPAIGRKAPIELPPGTPISGPAPGQQHVPFVSSPLRGTGASGSGSTTTSPVKKDKSASSVLKGKSAFPRLGKLDTSALGSPAAKGRDGEKEMLSPLVLASPAVSRQGSFADLAGAAAGGALGLVDVDAKLREVNGREDKGKGKEKRKMKWEWGDVMTSAEMMPPPPVPEKVWKGNGKGKARALDLDDEDEGDDMDTDDEEDMKRVEVWRMRRAMRRWIRKTTDRAEYEEAVRRGERYAREVRRSRSVSRSRSRATSPIKDGSMYGRGRQGRGSGGSSVYSERRGEMKRRRMSSTFGGGDGGSEVSVESERTSLFGGGAGKRRRVRSSGKYEPPRTDEELERRLREKQQEHVVRWSYGTFLEAVKGVWHRHEVAEQANRGGGEGGKVMNRAKWDLWISLNLENDGTAIWLERKFGMNKDDGDDAKRTGGVEGGKWVGKTVYQVPLDARGTDTTEKEEEEYPGLLVFEMTPLEGVEDPLERKARVLDDCFRLRGIVQALPIRRHYVPALLILHWPSTVSWTIPPEEVLELRSLLSSLHVDQKLISSYATFDCSTPTAELDAMFKKTLEGLQLDFEGRLTKRLSLGKAFKVFLDGFWEGFVDEWVGVCGKLGFFNWSMYAKVVEAAVALLNRAARSVAIFVSAEVGEIISGLEFEGVSDDSSAYEHSFQYLSTASPDGLAESITKDLQDHLAMEHPFPARIFLDHLRRLLSASCELTLPIPNQGRGEFVVLNSDLDNAVEDFRGAVAEKRAVLSRFRTLSMRREPKRRTTNGSVVHDESPSPAAKKRRLSPAVDSVNDATPSQSAFGTPATSPPSSQNGNEDPFVGSGKEGNGKKKERVSIAMLRALTKDVRERYGGSGGAAGG